MKALSKVGLRRCVCLRPDIVNLNQGFGLMCNKSLVKMKHNASPEAELPLTEGSYAGHTQATEWVRAHELRRLT